MSKALRTAAFVVGAVAIVAATGGIGAAPALSVTTTGVSTSVAATGASIAGISATAFSATTSVAAISAGVAGVSAATLTTIASGLALAANMTAKRPSGVTGSQTDFTADTQAGVPYAMGRTYVSGSIIYRKTTDGWSGKTKNDLQDFVSILSGGGPIQSLDGFYVDKALVEFDGGGNATGDYRDYMWMHTQQGQTPEPAALSRVAGSSPAPVGWTSHHKLSGYAADLWTLRFNKEGDLYQNGVPERGWVGHWVKVYDPRLDSTYPGGSGTCRALDEATYVWSDNPYLHALTWALGRWQNGKRVLGVGMPIAGIDVAAFVNGANIADANGWTVGGAVYSTDSKWNVLKQILQAGMGEPLQLGARLSCMVNAPRVALDTVTVGEVVGEASVTATQARRERFNAVIPRYRSEAHDWEIVSADKIAVATHVVEDGGERSREIDYALIQDVDQAAVAARYDIENAREFGPIVLPLKPRWIGYRPGDCINVVHPELGLNNQMVLILQRSLDAETGTVTLTCRSETTAKHAFALGQTGTAPPTPGVTSVPFPQFSWDELPDPTGTKPEDNATVGAIVGINLRDPYGHILTMAEVLNKYQQVTANMLDPALSARIEPVDALAALVAADSAQQKAVAIGTRSDKSFAGVAVEVKTAADAASAAASQVTQLTASIGDLGGATVEQKFAVAADALGTLQAQIYLKAQTTLDDGTVVIGGVTVGVNGVQSNIGLMAQKIYFSDQAGNVAQMVDTVGGVTYIREALIPKITAGMIEVDSLSAISANIGTLVSYSGPVARVVRDGRGTRVYDENNVLRIESGIWDD